MSKAGHFRAASGPKQGWFRAGFFVHFPSRIRVIVGASKTCCANLLAHIFICVILVVGGFADAQSQPAPPPPPPQILWQQRHEMRGMHDRMTLLAGDGGGYRIVGSSGFSNADKSFTETTWMMSLDSRGQKRDFNENIAKGNQAGVDAAFAQPNGKTLAIGGMVPWIAEFDPAGVLQPGHDIRAGDFDFDIDAAVFDKPDSLLVVGSRTVSYAERPQLMNAWLARIKPDGTVLWQKEYDRAHMDMAAAVLPMGEGGCVLAINSGKYNKFGAGPTALWLVRCDADGNKITDAVIEGAQIYPAGHKYLAPLQDDAFVVSYTVGQLSGDMHFEAHVAAYDGKLKPIWSSKPSIVTTVGSMLILRRQDDVVAVAGAIGGSPIVMFVDPRDGKIRREVMLPFDGNFETKDVLDEKDGSVVIVAAFQRRDRPRERDVHEDLLVMKVR